MDGNAFLMTRLSARWAVIFCLDIHAGGHSNVRDMKRCLIHKNILAIRCCNSRHNEKEVLLKFLIVHH